MRIGGTADAAFQEFAVTAFVEAMADSTVMQPADRAPVIAAVMIAPLRAAWGPPFDGDKAQGYDYSPTKLALQATQLGGGTSSFTATRAGDLPEFKVELTKPGAKRTVTVKLDKGAGPGEWLVKEVTDAK